MVGNNKIIVNFDDEIACFGSLLELQEYKHSFVSVFDKH